MQRHIRSLLGKAAIDLDHFPRIGIFQRHAIAGETEFVEQFTMLPSTFQHRRDGIGRVVLFFLGRIDTAAIHTDADGTIILRRHIDDQLHFVLPRLFSLVMIQMPRVVAHFIDMRRYFGDKPIIFLQIDRQICRSLPPNFSQRFGIFAAVDGNAHHIGAGSLQIAHLTHRGRHILRRRGRHALHGDRITSPNRR